MSHDLERRKAWKRSHSGRIQIAEPAATTTEAIVAAPFAFAWSMPRASTTQRQHDTELVELLVCYRGFARQLPDSLSPDESFALLRTHVCSTACSWWHDERCSVSVFICTTTGMLHRCGDAICTFIDARGSSRVCTLTGTVYGAEYVSEVTRQPGCGRAIYGQADGETSSSVAATDDDEGARAYVAYGGSSSSGEALLLVPTEDAASPSPRKKHRNKNNTVGAAGPSLRAVVRTVEGVTQRMLLLKGKPDRSPEQHAKLKEVARICVALWQRVVNTAEYARHRLSYTLEHHCQVVLWFMAGGGMKRRRGTDHIEEIPSSPFVTQCLPRLRTDRAALSPVLQGTLKNARKAFQDCMLSVPDHLLLDAQPRVAL
jgi:hypothetical protein